MEKGVDTLWKFEDVEVDERTHELRVAGQLVDLEPKPLEVLLYLLRHAGDVVTHDEVLDAVWEGRTLNPSTVGNAISKVRQALGSRSAEAIKTISKSGYRLIAKVETLESKRAAPAAPARTRGDVVPGRDNWTLVEQLPSGGFGDVWIAEHSKTHERRVFKFARSTEQLSALKREVTIYRLLQQASSSESFVRVLDWNFAQEPFFLESEFAGTNLRMWAQSRGGLQQLQLEERIRLGVSIARAVGAAHAVGVLHKDIKPENVLIGDGAERPIKLSDFGAGGLLHSDRLSQLGITQLGFTTDVQATSGTLMYVAPELISEDGSAPSVQSDVYALGVLLFQMYVGTFGRPLAPGWESDVDDELIRADIADATNGTPSRRLAAAQILADRLSQLPERRQELQRARAEQTRAAAAQRALERTLARRPWLIAAIAALAIGMAASSYFFVQASRQVAINRAFGDFVTSDILLAANPSTGGDAKIPLKDAIGNAASRIQTRFGSVPATELAINEALTKTLYTLHDFSIVVLLRKRAIELDRRLFGAADKRTLQSTVALGRDYVALSDEEQAKASLKVVAPLIAALNSPLDPLTLDARYLAVQVAAQFDPPNVKTAEMFKALLSDVQRANVAADFRSHVEQSYLVDLEDLEQWNELETFATNLVAEYSKDFGPTSARAMVAKTYLGKALLNQHKLEQATGQLTAALEGLTAIYGPSHGDTLRAVEGLSELYYQQGRWAMAVPLDKQLFEGARKEAGDSATWAIEYEGWLARDTALAGHPAEALPIAEHAVESARTNYGPESILVAENSLIEAHILVDLVRTKEAGTLLRNLRDMPASTMADDTNWAGRLYYLTARLEGAEGEVSSARTDAAKSLELITAAAGLQDIETTLAATLVKQLAALPRTGTQ